MKDLFYKRLANILTIKSLVTLITTVCFAILTLRGDIPQDFMTIYSVIIAFYFGTQAVKEESW